jgi:alcohol dehydrogenase
VRLPHVPGHEFAGVIEAIGPEVARWREGARVTVPFAVGCGRCPQCRAGRQHICDDHFQPGFTAWGAFAPLVAVPHADANLVALPDDLTLVDAASLGCRFATAWRAVVAQGALAPDEWIAVHGCGGVGLSAVMIARALDARVIAIDVDAAARALARRVGAEHVIDARDGADVAGAVRELTGGGAHVSIDAIGSRAACRASIAGLRKHGRHVQVGLLVGADHEPPIAMHDVIARELTIVGSHGMPGHAYAPMLEMIRAGRLDPGRLVTRRVTLEEGARELVTMGDRPARGVVVIDQF